jgi:regulatory protein
VPRSFSGDPYQAALRLLARRDRSTFQLHQALCRQGFPESDIDPVLRQLTEDGALNDARFALTVARKQAYARQKGRIRVLRELQAVGIARDVARRAVDEVFGEIDEDEALERALARRIRSKPLDPAHLRRVHAALVRQGFSPSKAAAALRARLARMKT